MTVHHISDDQRPRRIAFIHAGAISVAFVSGTVALVALLLGSPLEYGSALALCGTAWIVAHIAERLADQERIRRRRSPSTRRRREIHFAPSYVRLHAPAHPDCYSPGRERILTTV